MSKEPERSRRRTNSFNTVSPEPASDQSAIQNVVELLQDYVPQVQAVTGPKEERKGERVLWATFETGDINDVTMGHHSTVDDTGALPLLLILGFAMGYSVWVVQPGGDAREVWSAWGEGEVVRVGRLLRTPERCEGVGADKFASQRPIIALVRKGRHSSSMVAYSSLHLVSLRGEGRTEDKTSDCVVRRFTFSKTKPIVNLKCNRRVVAVVFQKRIVVLDAGTYDHRFIIRNGYPTPDYPCNPVALGTRWMAYSETKLVSKHQSVGGVSETTPPSVTTTVLQGVKKGFSAITETISGLAGMTQQSLQEPTAASQASEQATANVVTILDVNHRHPEEVRLQEQERGAGVVAHFMAHSVSPGKHIAALAFNPSGTLLVSASTEGHSFHVFRILPHLWFSSEAAVHHLFTLYRGATSATIQDVAFSQDSRWVAVSTLNGTAHVFPITPYGGNISVRTHTSSRVVNQLSRFHTSAGIEPLPSYHSRVARRPSYSPPKEGSHTVPQLMSTNYSSGYNGWSNPRRLPLPPPIAVKPLQQIKQPYLSTLESSGKSSGGGVVSSAHGSRGETSREPFVTLAGLDAICVRTTFSPSCTGWRGMDSEQGPQYSLYVVGSHGILTEHVLEPRAESGTAEGDDAPVELTHHSNICWKLHSRVQQGSILLPLSEKNPLIAANNVYREFCEKAKDRTKVHSAPKTDGEWLSQVEILTYAPPSRRLWMGPQFTFKTYQPAASPGSQVTSAILKTPSPPNTTIYSEGSSNMLAGSSGRDPMSGFPSPGTGTRPGTSGSQSGTQGSRQEEDSASQSIGSAVLSTTPDLVDLLSDPPELRGLDLKSVHTSPLPMPTVQREEGRDGMESGPASLDPGVLEVFGSWNKVAPRLDGSTLEAEVEKELADAMWEDSQGVTTVVSSSRGAKRGFHTPHENL